MPHCGAHGLTRLAGSLPYSDTTASACSRRRLEIGPLINTPSALKTCLPHLQVICSKLGISLRRRIFDIGTGVRSRSYRKAFPHQAHSCQETTMPEPVEEPQPISLPVGEAKAAVPSE